MKYKIVFTERAAKDISNLEPEVIVGCNDLCPCGSGKKYKYCFRRCGL